MKSGHWDCLQMLLEMNNEQLRWVESWSSARVLDKLSKPFLSQTKLRMKKFYSIFFIQSPSSRLYHQSHTLFLDLVIPFASSLEISPDEDQMRTRGTRSFEDAAEKAWNIDGLNGIVNQHFDNLALFSFHRYCESSNIWK